ncbi:SDR family oxidoreductase [Subtercola boreus]|uniref:NAD(P)-dependent oxidoreductase n=1 Tax=Subtercola boreus TaxID=120213 RepID=A0A3E0W9V8_9MICO|nr:SDR family oxidoreductase [Subtercola boreus]RFA20630.1 NAD(P)-dependent oxidoreductase [Subtercola boreus]RFA20744.1 NAD(P)-dependent oxidoreductase [Subtercola boreus]RFA26955.1 NAD(P)-dependent oxidoreductase [Subtercola boreus]
MTDSPTVTIGVTGATGHIGGGVASRLDARGRGFRMIVRDATRAPSFDSLDVTVSVTEYRDPHDARAALEGVDVLFMVSAAESDDRVAEHVQFVQSAVEAGVGHIVYTSFVGAGPDAAFTLARDHGETERAIRASGVDYTFLRDNFYLDLLPHWADENGVIRGPAGDGRMAAVARDDVADVAALVLLEPGEHRGAVYEITGAETLTFTDVARRASAATGRPLTFVNETVDEAYASRAHYGAPAFMVDAWVSTYTGVRDGELERVTEDVERLTGRAPRTLEDVLAGR